MGKKLFPEVLGIKIDMRVQLTMPNGKNADAQLHSVDDFFNGMKPNCLIGLVFKESPPVFGLFDRIVQCLDNYFVVIRSKVNQNYKIYEPVDDIIGWFKAQ